jgi:peptide/nickel transport system substrate-binding protein
VVVEVTHSGTGIASDDGGTIIPFFPNFVYARNKKVRHTGEVAASWPMDGGRAAQRWWFEG